MYKKLGKNRFLLKVVFTTLINLRNYQKIYFTGLLAGNVFDWGAKEVALLMESKDGLKFEDALAFVKPRPWLVDHLDEWKERLKQKKPHKCAAIFIDNSGFDVILGIFPFVVEMLRLVMI